MFDLSFFHYKIYLGIDRSLLVLKDNKSSKNFSLEQIRFPWAQHVQLRNSNTCFRFICSDNKGHVGCTKPRGL